jgi:hypothetical protein
MSLELTESKESRKNPVFEGWITGRMPVVLYVRKCKPQTARSIQTHRVRRMGPRLEHSV